MEKITQQWAMILLYIHFSYLLGVRSDLCPPLPNVEVGQLSYMPSMETRGYPIGAISGLNCPETHFVVGPAVAICYPYAKWSVELGRCKEIKDGKPCTKINNFPGTIFYSDRVKRDQVPSGTTAHFKCSQDTTMHGYDRSLCYDGQWSNLDVYCLHESDEPTTASYSDYDEQTISRRCPAIVPDIHSYVYYPNNEPDRADTFEEGAQVIKKCHRGFILKGPGTAICRAGEWRKLGQCLRRQA